MMTATTDVNWYHTSSYFAFVVAEAYFESTESFRSWKLLCASKWHKGMIEQGVEMGPFDEDIEKARIDQEALDNLKDALSKLWQVFSTEGEAEYQAFPYRPYGIEVNACRNSPAWIWIEKTRQVVRY